jgi:hypothetical protein
VLRVGVLVGTGIGSVVTAVERGVLQHRSRDGARSPLLHAPPIVMDWE